LKNFMRKPIKRKNKIKPDLKFNSLEVSKLINYVMERGKKNTARKIVYDAFDEIKKTTKREPLEVFEQAIVNVGPTVEIRSRRVGGANYQVPVEVRPERRFALALRWMIDSAKSGKGKPMAEKLANEIIQASNNEGAAVTKRENTHKMAEANKAFAHFAW